MISVPMAPWSYQENDSHSELLKMSGRDGVEFLDKVLQKLLDDLSLCRACAGINYKEELESPIFLNQIATGLPKDLYNLFKSGDSKRMGLLNLMTYCS